MNSEIESGQLFIFNKDLNAFESIGEITEAELTSANEEPERLKYFNSAFEESFEATMGNVNKYTFYLLIGQKYRIPNNWLKRHGQPMNRKMIKKTPAIIKRIKRYRKRFRRWKKKQR